MLQIFSPGINHPGFQKPIFDVPPANVLQAQKDITKLCEPASEFLFWVVLVRIATPHGEHLIESSLIGHNHIQAATQRFLRMFFIEEFLIRTYFINLKFAHPLKAIDTLHSIGEIFHAPDGFHYKYLFRVYACHSLLELDVSGANSFL